jgi:Haem-degrading
LHRKADEGRRDESARRCSRQIALDCHVSIAVVDDAGHLIAFTRSERAELYSIAIAQAKAKSAGLTRFPSGKKSPTGNERDDHHTRCSMRRWPDSAWPMCRRTWRSHMWHKDVSSECLRTGARLFRGITSITRAGVTPHRHSPCWLMRCATGVSAAGSASGEILNQEFLKLLGPISPR